MPYLIDGHNLIGQLPDIDLADPDDEWALIERLWEFCRANRAQATVYFDRGEPLSRDPPSQAGLTVHFVRGGIEADAAVTGHLRRLGGAAKNWTVVSSDRRLAQAARQAGARWLSSEAFVRTHLTGPTAGPPPEKPDGVNEHDIDEWLDLFSEGSADE